MASAQSARPAEIVWPQHQQVPQGQAFQGRVHLPPEYAPDQAESPLHTGITHAGAEATQTRTDSAPAPGTQWSVSLDILAPWDKVTTSTGCCPAGSSWSRQGRGWWTRCAATWSRSPACFSPGSVNSTDLALRAFAGFLAEAAPEVTSTAQVTRRHIEDYKPWLANRPGQNKARVTTATLAHRLGTLRMFFVRIDEWGWDEAPPRVPMFPGDLPRQDHPLPKALDDAAAAKLLRAARTTNGCWSGSPSRCCCAPGCGSASSPACPPTPWCRSAPRPWLHVPVGKLREDRYLPLHPQLVTLIDDYRNAHVPAEHPLLLPRENGRPWTGTPSPGS